MIDSVDVITHVKTKLILNAIESGRQNKALRDF